MSPPLGYVEPRKTCKAHAPHATTNPKQPRGDGYCSDSCFTLGQERRVQELEAALRELIASLDRELECGGLLPLDPRRLDELRKVLK